MTRKLKVEYGPPSALKANAYNVNVVSPENEAKIDASIKRFGFFKPILCRENGKGALEIVGGEHRWQAAVRLGLAEIPFTNLGPISDVQAKEIGLVDNGRYGSDDSLRLADLLGSLDVNAGELATFMPYSESDFNAIFSSVEFDLDDLDLGEEDEKPKLMAERPPQTHQILRFKVPIGDAGRITDRINKVMKQQKFKDGDELENAGDALVHILSSEE